VRVELERQIGRLLPDLPKDARTRLRTLTIETLEKLAKDQLPRVRQVLAEEIKSLDCVPKRMIKLLPRDVEAVSAPSLEYSPLLADADLIEIVTSAQARHALTAIARRRPLGANVSEAIGAMLDVPSVAKLLSNSSAEICRQTMDKIIEHAAQARAWHLPLMQRGDLSRRAVRRVAGFVSAALMERLTQRHGLDEETRQQLNRQMRARIEAGDTDTDRDPASLAASEAEKFFQAGKLDDAFVESAAEAGRREAVVIALSLLAGAGRNRAPHSAIGRGKRGDGAGLALWPLQARRVQDPNLHHASAGSGASSGARRHAFSHERRRDALTSGIFRSGSMIFLPRFAEEENQFGRTPFSTTTGNSPLFPIWAA
jgi:uncharacterized protein (DUF2336 family)